MLGNLTRATKWTVAGWALVVTACLPLLAQPSDGGLKQTQHAGAVKLPGGVKALPDVVYATIQGDNPRDLHMDIYLPPRVKGPVPVIVWIHGGGWVSGTHKGGPGPFLAMRGYAVASVEYRLSGEAIWPAQIHDCKAAIRFLRANAGKYNLDADRVGVWGASAGGHLAALLGTTGDDPRLEGSVGILNMPASRPSGEGNESKESVSSRVQAVCDFFGPTDLKAIIQAKTAGEQAAAEVVVQLFGGKDNATEANLAAASPITYVTKDAAPFLIMHGDKDRLVPLSQSRSLYNALHQAKADVTLRVIKGAGHGFRGNAVNQAVLKFFNEHLKKSSTSKSAQPRT